MTGRLHGVGVGPGDPDLMTIRAQKVIGACGAVFFIEADGRPSRARATAAAAIPADAEEVPVAVPMRAEPGAAAKAYDMAAARIAELMERGVDVAVLCEGDPLLYGSFIYLLERLEPAGDVEIVPGLPSFVAAAAAARLPLVRRDETLSLVPATLPETRFEERLASADCVAILKTGRHLPRIRGALQAAGMLESAVVVQDASLPGELVRPLAGLEAESLPYFALIIARRGGEG